LPTFGRANDHHMQAVDQALAAFGIAAQRRQGFGDRTQTRADFRRGQEIDVFVGKIQRRLDVHPQLRQRFDYGVDAPGKLAIQGAAGGARRGIAAGGDQVGNRFGLGQVELVVEEGALGELAGTRPRARPAPGNGAAVAPAAPGCRAPAVRPRPSPV
jgi:hypothetical protein